jgi:hypothetical protein
MGKKLIEAFNRNIFLAAIMIVIIVFIVGYFTITIYDNTKRTNLMDEFTILNQQIGLDEIYDVYLEEKPELKCEILNNQLSSQLRTNERLFNKLKQYNENAIVDTDNVVKYQLVITNIKLWLQYNKIIENCNSDIKVMLYFYPEVLPNTPQKVLLDAKTVIFESKLQKIMADCSYLSIALPDKSDIEIINLIKSEFEVIDSPSALINGKMYYDVNFTSEFYEEINCNE